MKKFSLVLGVIFVFAFHMVSSAQPHRFINSDSLMQAFDKFENSKVVYNRAMTELNKRTEVNDFLTILHAVNLDPDNQQFVAAAERFHAELKLRIAKNALIATVVSLNDEFRRYLENILRG